MFKVRLHLGSSERNPANDLCQSLLPQSLLEQTPKTKATQIPLTPVVYPYRTDVLMTKCAHCEQETGKFILVWTCQKGVGLVKYHICADRVQCEKNYISPKGLHIDCVCLVDEYPESIDHR